MGMCRSPASLRPANMRVRTRCVIEFLPGRKSWGPMLLSWEKRMCGDSRIVARRSNRPWARRYRGARRVIHIAAAIGIRFEWMRGVLRREPAAGRAGCSTCQGWPFDMSLPTNCVLLQSLPCLHHSRTVPSRTRSLTNPLFLHASVGVSSHHQHLSNEGATRADRGKHDRSYTSSRSGVSLIRLDAFRCAQGIEFLDRRGVV